MKKYDFQPCPLCGNCQSYRRSVKIDKQVIEPAACAKRVKPERVTIIEGSASWFNDKENGREERQAWTCVEFGNRNKKNKRMKNRMKKWERQFSY